MYRRPKFLEILIEIRQEMALEADYDVDLFAERVRGGMVPPDDATQVSSDTEAPSTTTTLNGTDKRINKKRVRVG